MGPWIVGTQHASRIGEWTTQVLPISEANAARAVALVYCGFGDGDDVARLIAAAPDLLAALQMIVPNFNLTRMILTDSKARELAGEMIEQARAAIIKATGEQS
jgi:hypothetical protein